MIIYITLAMYAGFLKLALEKKYQPYHFLTQTFFRGQLFCPWLFNQSGVCLMCRHSSSMFHSHLNPFRLYHEENEVLRSY